MPLLSSLTSAACEELEWACLLSESMLLISTSFLEWPNAMMAQELVDMKIRLLFTQRPNSLKICERRNGGLLNDAFVQGQK